MDARKMVAAGLLARGATQEHTVSLLSPPISGRQLRRWIKEPAFQREMERVQANSNRPDPEGVLLDALSATTDDGVRWDTRVKAAIELRNRPQPGSNGTGGANAGGGLVTMIVHYYRCEKCGEITLTPPDGIEIEEAEFEEITPPEIPAVNAPSLDIPDGRGNR